MPLTNDGIPYTGSTPDSLDTSHTAAVTLSPYARMSGREKVLAVVRNNGSLVGATDDEIQVATGLDPSTERPRRVELCQEGILREMTLADGLRLSLPHRRKTRADHYATVWVETEK